jgi:hypothetical protein
MDTLLSVFLGFVYGYLVATYIESLIHDIVMHSTWIHKYAFNRTKVSHEDIHHIRTFKLDHITQFSSKKEKDDLDKYLYLNYHGDAEWIINDDYGLTLDIYSLIYHNLTFVPLMIVTYLFTEHLFFLCSVVPMVFVSFMSKYFHPYFHCSFDKAMNTAPFVTRIILDTPVMRRVWRLHYVHHKFKKFNFNLLLGGDYIRGVLREPSKKELEEMCRLGIPTW